MRIVFAVLSTMTLVAVSACSPQDAQTNNPAIATDSSAAERASQAPAEGANSYTEDQARERLITKGYTNPTALSKAADGTWQGQATLKGQQVNVAVDYQGNVVTH